MKCSRCSTELKHGDNERYKVLVTFTPTRYDHRGQKEVLYTFCRVCYSINFDGTSIRKENWL